MRLKRCEELLCYIILTTIDYTATQHEGSLEQTLLSST